MRTYLHKQMGKIISGLLVGGGTLLLVISLLPGGGMKITLPLVFLMLGSAFMVFTYIFSADYRWAAFLYIPGCLLLTLGIIFLLNTITGDRKAWAYAWLLLLSGAGLGAVFAGRQLGWQSKIILASGGVVFLGIAFFAIFGVIAGGLFIQVMAPILLVLAGLAFRWSGLEKMLSDRLTHRQEAIPAEGICVSTQFKQPNLIEPLSKREIEVLRLIDLGLSNAEIAARLTLAPSTVKTHINNIYGKLEVQTRVQAIKRGHELGLLDGSSTR